MNTRVRLLLIGWCLALAVGLPRARAQWVTQTNGLKAGWNAVFLHVDASHSSITTLLLGSNSIDEIWLWKPEVSAQQFVTSPQSSLPSGSRWLAWKRTESATSPLQKLIPNAAYLVRVRSDTPTHEWKVIGRPVVPRYQWTSSGLNFIGFPTIATNGSATLKPPTFDSFLAQASSDFIKVAEIFRYPGGDLAQVKMAAPRSTSVRRGEAFWIRSGEIYNRYYGPFEVVSGSGDTVDFWFFREVGVWNGRLS